MDVQKLSSYINSPVYHKKGYRKIHSYTTGKGELPPSLTVLPDNNMTGVRRTLLFDQQQKQTEENAKLNKPYN
jgi:hypothetical protein